MSSETLDRVRKWCDESRSTHDEFVRFFERNEAAYRGMLNPRSSAAKWRHRLHPPYAFNLIETVVASTIEQGLRVAVRPSPKVNPSLEEAQMLLTRAKSVEYLIRHEHRVDDMDSKQRPLALCAAIGGTAIGKSYWNWLEGPVQRNAVIEEPIYDGFGLQVGSVPRLEQIIETKTKLDHSTFEVIDPRDFIIHESARALQPTVPGGAQYVMHRCYYSMEQLRLWEASGFLKNVEDLSVVGDRAADDRTGRDKVLFGVDRYKDLVEVLECWYFEKGQVWRTLVGNMNVVLREPEANPFWHGEYPFVEFSMAPGLFSPRGVGTMELIYQLQEMMWELGNQRLDNIEIINNAIMLIRSDIDDPEAFEYFPGARWQVDDTNQVQALMPPYQLASLTLEAEALLKGDLQNVTAAAPFVSGTETATVDQTTATGASIVMNAAQQAMAAKKWQFQKGLAREVEMRIKNCQQFITEGKLVHILGEDGAVAFRELTPLDIQGEYVGEIELMGESLMRQERRAEALQLSQVMAQMAPLMQAMGTPLNMQEVLKWALRLWDIQDAERFFSQVSSPQVAGMGQPDPGAGAEQVPGTPSLSGELANMGITSGSAVDASSPSAVGGISGSPVAALQRALAMGGGVANA
jgi:hypothetical protein